MTRQRRHDPEPDPQPCRGRCHRRSHGCASAVEVVLAKPDRIPALFLRRAGAVDDLFHRHVPAHAEPDSHIRRSTSRAQSMFNGDGQEWWTTGEKGPFLPPPPAFAGYSPDFAGERCPLVPTTVVAWCASARNSPSWRVHTAVNR